MTVRLHDSLSVGQGPGVSHRGSKTAKGLVVYYYLSNRLGKPLVKSDVGSFFCRGIGAHYSKSCKLILFDFSHNGRTKFAEASDGRRVGYEARFESCFEATFDGAQRAVVVIGKLGYTRTTRHDGGLNKLDHRTGATVSIRIVVKTRIHETIQGKIDCQITSTWMLSKRK